MDEVSSSDPGSEKASGCGSCGEILGIEASFGFWNPFDEKARLYNKQLGGGALLDVGIYPLNLACFLMGKLPVKTESQAVLGETGVDEINAMLLTFEQEEWEKGSGGASQCLQSFPGMQCLDLRHKRKNLDSVLFQC